MLRRTGKDDRGAVAVEFALVFPILILVLVGIVEFGSMFNAQLLLTGAAREGAREMSLTGNLADAQSAAVDSANGLVPALVAANVAATPCAADTDTTTVTITYIKPFLTGMFGASLPLTATSTRRCDG